MELLYLRWRPAVLRERPFPSRRAGADSPVQISNCRTACSMNISMPRNDGLLLLFGAADQRRFERVVDHVEHDVGGNRRLRRSSRRREETCRAASHARRRRSAAWTTCFARQRLGAADLGERAHAIRIAARERDTCAPASSSAQAAPRAAPPLPTISTRRLSPAADAATEARSRRRRRCWRRATCRPCATPCSPRRCAEPADRPRPDSA